MKPLIYILIILTFSASKIFAQQNDSAQQVLNSKEKEIIISADNCKISGTLVSKNNTQNLAIIIAGSGPTDRNGNNPLGVSANSYKILAEELSKQNIASFRFDKRGIAKSGIKNFNEKNLVFDEYINDVSTIFDYIKDSLGFKNIYFVGHSEGSLIGMIASEQRPIRGYISLSGAGRPIDVVIKEQVNKQPELIKNQVDSIFTILKQGKTVDSVPQYLYSIFRPSIQPYMISWLKYSPAEEIKKLHCPILILQGTCDVQVKIEDAQNLHEANNKSKIDIIPAMTHTLKNAGENCDDENLKTYKDSTLPLNTQLVNDIISFIQAKEQR